jgi:hypothetical protein
MQNENAKNSKRLIELLKRLIKAYYQIVLPIPNNQKVYHSNSIKAWLNKMPTKSKYFTCRPIYPN